MPISTLSRGLIVAATACAVAVGATACGDDGSPAASTTTSTTASSSSAASSPTTAVTGSAQTIADYIKQNGITETKATPGQDGAPNIDVPTPDGWVTVDKASLPDYALGAIKYGGAKAPGSTYTANIVALFSKLTGPVDVNRLFELAPGELRNLDEFSEIGSGHTATFAGYPSYKIAGRHDLDGMTALTAQQTVIIQSGDAVYVLQMNATSDETQVDELQSAMDQVDAKTVIGA